MKGVIATRSGDTQPDEALSTSAHMNLYSSTADAEPTITKPTSTTTADTAAERIAIPPHRPRTRSSTAGNASRLFT